jgi:hypothetical protein
MDRWDIPTTENAVIVAGFPEEVFNWIWEPEAFTLF